MILKDEVVKKVKGVIFKYNKNYIRNRILCSMGYREEILKQLYKVLEYNSVDARMYFRFADKCKPTSLKYFFKKLSLQKRLFCRRISYEIRELEREIELISEKSIYHKEVTIPKSFSEVISIKKDGAGLIKYCYNREQQYIELYKSLISQTHFGSIREMLLSQKFYIQLILNEIKNLETKQLNIKNEGKINYS